MAKSFEDRDGWIWMDGKFVPWREATIHVITQGLHYASSVFEGERAYNGKIFKSKEHTERLFNSAKIIGINIPYSKDEINDFKNQLLEKMNYKCSNISDGFLGNNENLGWKKNNLPCK